MYTTYAVLVTTTFFWIAYNILSTDMKMHQLLHTGYFSLHHLHFHASRSNQNLSNSHRPCPSDDNKPMLVFHILDFCRVC